MIIKNADMPAMPIELSGFGQYEPEAYIGLTKRETLAINANVDNSKFTTREALVEFAGRDYDDQDVIDSLKFTFEVEAKLKVMAADALLAELEK